MCKILNAEFIEMEGRTVVAAAVGWGGLERRWSKGYDVQPEDELVMEI